MHQIERIFVDFITSGEGASLWIVRVVLLSLVYQIEDVCDVLLYLSEVSDGGV